MAQTAGGLVVRRAGGRLSWSASRSSSRLRRDRFDASTRFNGLRERGQRQGRAVGWLRRRMLDKLNSYRRPGESYSDVILRLAEEG